MNYIPSKRLGIGKSSSTASTSKRDDGGAKVGTAPDQNLESRQTNNNPKSRFKRELAAKHRSAEVMEPAALNEEFPCVYSRCQCCGTSLGYPRGAKLIKCLVCFTCQWKIFEGKSEISEGNQRPLSYQLLKTTVANGTMKDVDLLIQNSFSSVDILNKSFILYSNKQPSYNSPNLNFNEIKKFYLLLDQLSTKKPMFKLLVSALHSLRHPPFQINTRSINWILIILECPLLLHSISGKSHLSPQFKGVSYDIIKRIFGLLAHLDPSAIQNLCHWWSRLPVDEFQVKVDLINLYITFHLNRIYTHIILDKKCKLSIPISQTAENINYKDQIDMGLFEAINNENSLINALGLPLPSLNRNSMKIDNDKIQISINQYSEDWHLKTACKTMSYLFFANKKLQHSSFYNNLVDYINIKQDFDSWEFLNSFIQHESIGNPNDLTIDLLKIQSSFNNLGMNFNANGYYNKPKFTFCSYPFLISLGSKISILQHEVKKSIGRTTEMAFISSIAEGKKVQDIYFKMRVRRSHLTIDSLKQIQSHPKDLKKLLKVEFINEPGIDAGGLKKEWFLLLSKKLFDPNKKLFTFYSSSNFAYFSINNNVKQNELYFLVGVIVGLAIYNTMILDVKFPQVVYRKLKGQKPTLDDFIELEPILGEQLKNLLKLSKDEIEELNITFELTYSDVSNNIKTVELMPNGSNIKVNSTNKYEYVSKYYNFFLTDIIANKFNQFHNGFKLVMNSNSLNLFSSKEIQLLVSGDDENTLIDVNSLKLVTNYLNCSYSSPIVTWFWDYFNELALVNKRKLLRFITGSDKVPATGFSSLNLKINFIDGNLFRNNLPVAHTCFNEICLYDWPDIEMLRAKFNVAINESNEFGLK